MNNERITDTQVITGLELNANILLSVAKSILEYTNGNVSKEKLLKNLESLHKVPDSVKLFMD